MHHEAIYKLIEGKQSVKVYQSINEHSVVLNGLIGFYKIDYHLDSLDESMCIHELRYD